MSLMLYTAWDGVRLSVLQRKQIASDQIRHPRRKRERQSSKTRKEAMPVEALSRDVKRSEVSQHGTIHRSVLAAWNLPPSFEDIASKAPTELTYELGNAAESSKSP
ncbi:hypothetical protein LTR56_023578 [Elasticomyces elasticus]|nr:hypothetical protein LTR56_023578 [Elasticomyces elasticus]KAK3624103.1 hypothetical protein LTR22_024118 [Elasticomyces elasticus]KAK5724196.1 hypothetical protein LTS12_027511 [Elasticomyces elasticus]